MGYELSAFEQALNNPKTSTALNEWMDARLGAQLQTLFEPRFKEIEVKLNTEREFIEHLKGQVQVLEEKNRALEEKNQALQNHLHQYLSNPSSSS